MKTTIFNRLALAIVLAVTVIGLGWAAEGPQSVDALGKTELKRALLGTVRVAVPIDAEKDMLSTGSGTVLTPDGIILTNFHVMGDKKAGTLFNKQGLAVIGVNPPDLQGLPTWTYLAIMVKGDAKLDLAVLKVVKTVKGGDLPQSLGLVMVPLADSDKVEIGDELSAIGFPSLGGDSVTYTNGSVSGFLDEDGDAVKEWFKTDAEINHGNSGGLAVNAAGEMIGVPTAGVADASFSGKIGLVRPVNRALPLLKAVLAGGSSGSPSQPAATAGPRVANIVFSDSVDANDRPGKTGTLWPSGITALYVFFDYAGFSNGKKIEYQWEVNGQALEPRILGWASGERGTWWYSLTNKSGLPDGTYDFSITFDGVKLAKARAAIGKAATPAKGSISNVVFAEGVDKNQPLKPHKADEPFASGVTEIYAFYEYKDMQDGAPWTNVWSIDGEEVLRTPREWTFGPSGAGWVSLASKSGLPNGRYKLQLYIGDALAAGAEITVGAPGDKPVPAAEGVQAIGLILDADTKEPLPGAVFVVVKDGVDLEAFYANPTEEAIFGMGICDSKGIFVLNTVLQRGKTYGVVAAAKGYQPTLGRIVVAADAKSPLQYELWLRKR